MANQEHEGSAGLEGGQEHAPKRPWTTPILMVERTHSQTLGAKTTNPREETSNSPNIYGFPS